MKLTGTLTREFFGGEVWVLRTDEGAQYQLTGDVPAALEGHRVNVQAEPSDNAFGIGMIGPILDVQSVEAT